MGIKQKLRISMILALAGSLTLFVVGSSLSAPSEPVEKTATEEAKAEESKPPESTIEIVEKEKDAPARTVFIRMEKIEGAKRYEAQIRSGTQKWKDPFEFRTEAGTLKIRLTPSKYEIRARSEGKGNQRGDWGAWSEFIVPFRSVTSVVPADGAIIQSTGQATQLQTFEWPRVGKAAGYYVEIRDKAGKAIRQLKTAATWVTSPLTVNAEFKWCVLPLADIKNEIPDSQSCRFASFRIDPTQNDLPAALTTVEARPGAIGYQYEIIRYENAQSTGDPIIIESETPQLRAQLKASEYEMRVRTIFPENYRTDWSPPQKFFVRQPAPINVGPAIGAELEGGQDGDGEVKLEWKAIPGVERYDIYVFDAEGKIYYQTTTKETFAVAMLPEEQTYLWKVVAYSPREPNRAPAAVVSPEGASQFYVKPYFPYQFTASEHPAPLYSWARYTVSSADYYSESYDDNAIVRQSIQAGELDAALGYWFRKKRFGFLAQAGVEGYRTNTDSAFFKGGSLNVGYRFIGEENLRLKIWLGYGYREIASLTANPTTQQYEIKSLDAAGPRFQFTYANQFTDTWGYQLHGKMFLGLSDKGTPNREKQGTQLSLSIAAALTHPLSKRTFGLLGYTYQFDSGSYASADTVGKSNTTKISGHYLTLGLEFAVGEPKR